MKKQRTLIISPSGNLYGSEKVLLDFLRCSRKEYDLYMPAGRLFDALKDLPRVRCHHFRSVVRLYLKLFFVLLSGRVHTLYCNEGGHIRYIRLLAKIFPHIRFLVHLRIVEDCKAARLGKLPSNLQLITVSDYLQKKLSPEHQLRSVMLHDPYISTGRAIRTPEQSFRISSPIRIGVIGRITRTKGLGELVSLTDHLEKQGLAWEFHLFGSFDSAEQEVIAFQKRAGEYRSVRVIFEGFVNSMAKIYQSVDVVLHFSRVEPLGRIFFEALDCGCCFAGFKAGGIGEIAHTLGIDPLMIVDDAGWESRFADLVNSLRDESVRMAYFAAQQKMDHAFSAVEYTKHLEDLLYDI